MSGIKLLTVTVCIVISHAMPGQHTTPSRDIQAQQFFSAIYNFSFAKADSCINNTPFKSEAITFYLKLNFSWWMLITTNDSKYITESYVNILNGMNALDNCKYDPELKSFLRIGFESYRLRLLMSKQKLWRSFKQAKYVALLVSGAVNKEPNNDNILLTSGLFNYFGSIGNKRYPFLFWETCFDNASKSAGIACLKKCELSNDIMIRTEATYFLMKIFSEMEENNSEALTYASKLVTQYPSNITFKQAQLKLLFKLHKTAEATSMNTLLMKTISHATYLSKAQKIHLAGISRMILKENADADLH